MVDFETAWINLYDWCVDNSESLGIEKDCISKGHPLIEFSPAAPFLMIFALPDEDNSATINNPAIGTLTFTIFVAAKGDNDIFRAICNTVKLSSKIRKEILSKYHYVQRTENSKPIPEKMYGDTCIFSFELSSQYIV